MLSASAPLLKRSRDVRGEQPTKSVAIFGQWQREGRGCHTPGRARWRGGPGARRSQPGRAGRRCATPRWTTHGAPSQCQSLPYPPDTQLQSCTKTKNASGTCPVGRGDGGHCAEHASGGPFQPGGQRAWTPSLRHLVSTPRKSTRFRGSQWASIRHWKY